MITIRTAHKIALARAGYRVLKFGRRLGGKSNYLIARRNGIFWDLDLSEVIDFTIFLLGGFEHKTLDLYKRLVKPGAIVIDVGANIGAHSLPLAKLVGDAGKVVSVEPTSYAFRKLRRNVDLNPQLAPRIILEQALLIGTNGNKTEPEIYSSWPLEPAAEVHEKHFGKLMSTSGAATTTLDEIVNKNNLDKVDFIKIDVDGHEYQVLSGALETLKRFKPLIVMELEPSLYLAKPQEFDQIFTLLKCMKAVMTDVNSRRLLPLEADKIRKMIPDGASRNALIRFQ